MSPSISVGMEYHSQLKLFLVFELDLSNIERSKLFFLLMPPRNVAIIYNDTERYNFNNFLGYRGWKDWLFVEGAKRSLPY